MRIHLIAVGERMPPWVQQGYKEYAKRMPKECDLILKEIMPGKRTKNNDIARLINAEGKRMMAAIPRQSHVVALAVDGKQWSTLELATAMSRWQAKGQNVSLLVGGPDGLSNDSIECAEEKWSLSELTFPHPLVRIIVAEQLYRAWCVLRNHPYHRY